MHISGDETGGIHYENEFNRARGIIDYILKNSVVNERDENGNQVYKAKAKDGFLCYVINDNGKEEISCEYKGDKPFRASINEFSIEIENGELRIGNGKTGFILREDGEMESNSDVFSLPGADSKTLGNTSTLIEAYDSAFEYAKRMEYRINRDFPHDAILYTTFKEFEEFYKETKGKDIQLEEYSDKVEGSNEEPTNEDLDYMLDLLYATEWDNNFIELSKRLCRMPGFKQKLIEHEANNDSVNPKAEFLILNRMGDFIGIEDFADKVFMEKVAPKYCNSDGGLSFKLANALYQRISIDLEDPKILEEQLDFIEELKDVGVLRGFLKNIDESMLLEKDFQERILGVANDDIEVFKYLINCMDKEQLKNPEYMLEMINSHPNILVAFKEEYDNGKYIENPYKELVESEEFKDGILSMYAEKISASGKVNTTVVRGSFRSPTDTIYYNFAEGSPMEEFLEKMTWKTKQELETILDSKLREIEKNLYKEEKSENSDLRSFEIGKTAHYLRAAGIKKAVFYAQQENLGIFNPERLVHLRQQGLSTERVGKMAAEHTRTNGIKTTTGDIRDDVTGVIGKKVELPNHDEHNG